MGNNNETNKQIYSKLHYIFFVFVIMSLSFAAGMYFSKKSELVSEIAKSEAVYLGKITGVYSEPTDDLLAKDVDFALFWDVWDTLKQDYVDRGEIREKELFYGAIKGMVSSLNDPYTVFMDPKISQEFQSDLNGTFEGIGAEIGIRDEILTIIAPLDDMPAQKAGLKAGDKVLAINGDTTNGITIDEAVSRIRGAKDTDVVLTIYRDGLDEAMDIKITRGIIYVKSVKTELRDDGLYYVKISSFNGDTMDLFNEAVRDIIENNPKGIILDLRNDPGGYLETAIEMASEWINSGPIVIEQFSDGTQDEYNARGRARLKDYKTVVLVNEGSASASEIVSGALRDYDKAEIVGKKTFGKGSVQTLREFNDGSSVKITTAKWLTPNGSSINHEGIEPDYVIEQELGDEDYDAQLNKAVELLGGIVNEIQTASSTPEHE